MLTYFVDFVTAGSMKVQFADGFGRCSGRVEILYEDTWKSVRLEGWTNLQQQTSLDALCRMMDCGKLYIYGSDLFSHGNTMIWDYNISCPSTFQLLDECLLQPFQFPGRRPNRLKVICTGMLMFQSCFLVALH